MMTVFMTFPRFSWTILVLGGHFWSDALPANPSSQREGRFISDIVRLNPMARLAIGIQITVPISVFMPNWALIGRHNGRASHRDDYTWVKNPNIRKQELLNQCSSQRVEVEEYLSLLQIDLKPCQELFICEMANDPEKFQPLSEILLKKLAISNPLNSTSYLVQAARVGVESTRQCEEVYHRCPVDTESMLDMRLLWLWKLLTKVVNVQFTGEMDNSDLFLDADD